mgnify:CR=1 FL=1
MSILKSILHHYNKTTKSYDTLHPETESAQITDWNQGIVNTLASTALGTLVSTLTSDSLLATMIQKVLTATGVKYNIAQNGYLCFGSLYGDLIIQWGLLAMTLSGDVGTYGYCHFPISFSNTEYNIVASHRGTNAAIIYQLFTEYSPSDCTLCAKMYDGSNTTPWLANWIAIGL